MTTARSTMMLQLGAQAPEFSLPDVDDHLMSRSELLGRCLLVAFVAEGCPYTQAVRAPLIELAEAHMPLGLAVLAINPCVGHSPDNAPEQLARARWGFPYLVDASQRVAIAYRVACTPDFFLFDGAHRLLYRGRLGGPSEATDASPLRQAIEAALRREPFEGPQRPSVGTPVPWADSARPSYLPAPEG